MVSLDVASAPTASIIIPVHDAAETLGTQLSALASQREAPPFEVMLIMNRCVDDSRAVAAPWAPKLDLIVLDANDKASAAYARNVGARMALGQYLLFCDADDEVSPSWVAGMVRPLATGYADLVGGRILVDRSELPGWIYNLQYRAKDGRCVQTRSNGLPYVMSASLGCRRTAFEAVGGFDEAFEGAAAEEVDLASRMLRAGFRIGAAADADVSYRPRTTIRSAAAQVRGYERGAVVLAAKEGLLLNAPPNRRVMLYRLLKQTVHLIVRRREHRPLVVLVRTIGTATRLNAQRIRADARSIQGPRSSVTDFLVPLDTPVLGGLALQARPATANWYAERGIEKRTIACVEALLDEGHTFVDCGANVGVFTVAAAMRVGPRGRVIAFEPDPRSRSILEANVRRHGIGERVKVREEALGTLRGRRAFVQYANDTVSGFGTAPSEFDPGPVEATVEVAVIPLRDMVDGPVSMLKIDVEGFEPEVLKGADTVLARGDDLALVVELNPAALLAAGSSPIELFELLRGDEWGLWLIDDQTADRLQAVRELGPDPHVLLGAAPADWYGNVLAVRGPRRREVAGIVESMVS